MKHRISTRIVGVLLAMVMLVGLLPVAAMAATTIVSADAIVTVPANGLFALKSVTSAEPEKYSVEVDCWYKVSDGKLVYPTQTFVEGERYTLRVRFKAQSGYSFDQNTVFTVNGLETTSYASFYGGVQVTFTAGPSPVYTISFASGGGSGAMADSQAELGMYTLPSCAFTAPSGMQFKAWSLNGVEYAPGEEINLTENITLSAIWAEIPPNYYNVSFHAGGGGGAMATIMDAPGVVTLPANGFTAPENMRFRAWSANGAEYAPGAVVTLTDHTTFTAVWDAADEVTPINQVHLSTREGATRPVPGESSLTDPEFTLYTDALEIDRFEGVWRQYMEVDGEYGWHAATTYQSTASTTFVEGYWQYEMRLNVVDLDTHKVEHPCGFFVNGQRWDTNGNNISRFVFAYSPVYHIDGEGNVTEGYWEIHALNATADLPSALTVGKTLPSGADIEYTIEDEGPVFLRTFEWQKKSGSEWVRVTDSLHTVEAGGTYRLRGWLSLSESNHAYVFSDDMTLQVNGRTWTVDMQTLSDRHGTGTGASVQVYSDEYGGFQPIVISGLSVPYPGMTMDTAANYSGKPLNVAAHKPVSALWWDATDGVKLNMGEPFIDGHTYQFRVGISLSIYDYPTVNAEEISLRLSGISEDAYTVTKKQLKPAQGTDRVVWSCYVNFTCTRTAPDTSALRPKGNGTADNPFQIGTVGELYWFSAFTNGTVTASDLTVVPTAACAILLKDITVNRYLLNKDGTLTTTTKLAGWTPISLETPYTGTFDGRGYAISGLYYDGTLDDRGLPGGVFGYVGASDQRGEVKNLTVSDSWMRMSDRVGAASTGGIIGELAEGGKVNNCHFDGTVYAYVGNPMAATAKAGGVVGINEGTVQNCTAKGLVDGNISNAIGGIAGYNRGRILSCTNNATVHIDCVGLYSFTAGGIAGVTKNLIRDCSNNGHIYGGTNIGGIAGWAQGSENGPSVIERCYNIGTVDGAGIVAIMGLDGVVVKNCYNAGAVTCGGIAQTSSREENTLSFCHNVGDAGSYPIIMREDAPVAISNCFYLDSAETDNVDGTTYKSETMFGPKYQAVCKMLNSGDNVGNWEQGENYPVLAEKTGVTVSGTATSFGSETDNVILQLIAEGYSEADYEVMVQGNSAKYSIDGVAEGTYTLRVVKNNHIARSYTVTVDTDDVTQDVTVNLFGDATGDGKVNMKDWSRLYNHISEVELLSDYGLSCADVNQDGKINMKDWARLYAHISETDPLW